MLRISFDPGSIENAAATCSVSGRSPVLGKEIWFLLWLKLKSELTLYISAESASIIIVAFYLVDGTYPYPTIVEDKISRKEFYF